MKYKQFPKNSKITKQYNLSSQRLSLPTLTSNNARIEQKTQSITSLKYLSNQENAKSQRNTLLKPQMLELKSILKSSKQQQLNKPHNYSQQQKQQTQYLKQYSSVNDIYQKKYSGSKRPSKLFLNSKQMKNIPLKKKLYNLPVLLSEGNFIKKDQDSLDSSNQEDQKYKKNIFNDKKDIAEPQIWVIKKTKRNGSASFNQLQVKELLAKKLQDKLSAKNNFVPKLLTQNKSDLLITSTSKQLLAPQKTHTIKSNFPQTLPQPPPTVEQKPQKHIIQKLVGPQAVSKFYSRYKNIQKVKQLQSMRNQINPLTIILTILQSYNIPPKRMDIIKLKGDQFVLDLNQIGLGYSISIKAISDILEKIHFFQSINLSYNAIGFDRVDIIVPKLKGIRKIDLSHNKIGRQGADLIATKIFKVYGKYNNFNDDISGDDSDQSIDQSHLLQQLNLEENSLNDGYLNLFLMGAKSFQNIKVLNLSKNFLGNTFAQKLKQFLIDQHHLNELYLHWNDITAKGMKYLFQGLSVNKNLKVLDLSWNEIGYESIPAINNFFKKNNSLLHLDISNCNITYADTKQLAKSIQFNHSIFGLHYQGNQGFIDSLGFLHPVLDKQTKIKYSLRNQIQSRILGVQKRFHDSKYSLRQNMPVKMCWICDGWRQQVIIISKNFDQDQACFIHFDFQNYKGISMKDNTSGYYQIKKMLPSRKIKFFVTTISKDKRIKHQIAIPSKYQNLFQIQKDPTKIDHFFIQKKQFKNAQFLEQINVINKKQQQPQQLFDQDYEYQGQCLPRYDGSLVNNNLFKNDPPPLKAKTLRKKKRNTQKDKKARELAAIDLCFKQDENDSLIKSQGFIRHCAQFDIQNSKVKKIITQNQQINRLTWILQKNYVLFKNIYYHLSSSSVSGNSSIYHISQTKFDQFLDFMHFETKRFTKAKIRIKLITTLSTNDEFSKNNALNKDLEQRMFNRPQFFEFLLRVTIEKFCKKQKNRNQQELGQIMPVDQALQKMFQKLKTYQKHILHSLPQYWRSNYLYTYDISLVIKSYEHFIEHIYYAYSGHFQKNLNTKTQKKMLLNEFKQIFLDANMKKTRQSLKDAQVAFIQSKQMEIQEGVYQYGLKYNEFLEALVRMAYLNNVKPINTSNNKIWQRIQQMQNHHEIKISQFVDFEIPLFLKFESLLKKIYEENRLSYHLKKLDKIFENGIFSDQIQMLVEILKERIEEYHQKYKPMILKNLKKKKNKSSKANLNSFQHEQQQQKSLENQEFVYHNDRIHKKINLKYLVQELKQKFDKMAEQLNNNFIEYEEVSQNQDQKNKAV